MDIKKITADSFIDEISLFRHIEKTIASSGMLDELDLPDEKAPFEELAKLPDRALQLYYQWQKILHGDARVTVAVVGEFSTGKSTFINSLLKKEVCVATDSPTTAVLTRFVYGDTEEVYILDENNLRKEQISHLDYKKFSQHSKERSNAVSKHFEYQYPFDSLRNVILYDTPGYENSTNTDDDEMTSGLIKDIDIIVFLINIDKAEIGNSMLKRVKLWKEIGKKIYLIMNKSDLKSSKDRDDIQKSLSKKYNDIFADMIVYSSKNELLDMASGGVELPAGGLLVRIKKMLSNFFSRKHIQPTEFKSKRLDIINMFETIRQSNKEVVNEKFTEKYKIYLSDYREVLNKVSQYLKKKNNIREVDSLKQKVAEFEKYFEETTVTKIKSIIYGLADINRYFKVEEVSKDEKKFYFSPYYKIIFDSDKRKLDIAQKKNELLEILANYEKFFEDIFPAYELDGNGAEEAILRMWSILLGDVENLSYKPSDEGYFENEKAASKVLMQILDILNAKFIPKDLYHKSIPPFRTQHKNIIDKLIEFVGEEEGSSKVRADICNDIINDINELISKK